MDSFGLVGVAGPAPCPMASKYLKAARYNAIICGLFSSVLSFVMPYTALAHMNACVPLLQLAKLIATPVFRFFQLAKLMGTPVFPFFNLRHPRF